MLSVVYGLEKFHTYTYGRTVRVENDHKPLEAISRKPLHLAPKRLQAMLLRLQKYTAEINYRKGKEVVLADTLSRASLPNSEKELKFGQINMAKFLPITENRLKQIRQETEKDEVLQKLKLTIQQGWPEDKQYLPTEIIPYFHCRDKLTVQNGLIFRGERVVIPQSQRTELKTKVHTSHIGIEGCLRRARECLYWPNMSSDIKEYISTCETCSKFQCDQQPESLMPHEIPERPWQRVACDLFTLHNNDVITVDYYSNFWEIDRLNDTKSTTIIHKLKGHFSRYGIPDQLITDNGPQFVSDEFHRFTVNWDFEHLTTSPYNSKGNGKVESAVKTAKRLLRKARESGGDEYIAVLDYRNTPTQGIGSSPVQRLMNRRSKTLLPTHAGLLKPRVITADREKLKARQAKQKQLFDRHCKDLKPLEEEDVVRIKPFQTQHKVWKKGTIHRRLDERSYEVITDDGSLLRRNRIHLKQSKEQPNPSIPARKESPLQTQSRPTTELYMSKTPVKKPAESEDKSNPVTPQETVRTRSGRESKRPERFKDYDV